MLSKIRPAYSVTAGVILVACALVLAARYISTPVSLEPSAASIPVSVPARASERRVEPARPLPSVSLVSTVDEGADRGILLVRQCFALAERDPLAAMEMAAANQLQEIDPGLPASLIAQWASKDFGRAYEWVRAQEAGKWRDDILARIAYVRAQADPVAAARLVVTDISAGPCRDEAIISVIHQWALRDARGAGLWAHSLPDAALRQRASAEVAAIAASSYPK